MSKKAKLLARALRRPVDFTWAEAVLLMRYHGFELHASGSGGSGRLFRHVASGTVVRLHEPHPRPELKRYAIDDLLAGLRSAGELK